MKTWMVPLAAALGVAACGSKGAAQTVIDAAPDGLVIADAGEVVIDHPCANTQTDFVDHGNDNTTTVETYWGLVQVQPQDDFVVEQCDFPAPVVQPCGACSTSGDIAPTVDKTCVWTRGGAFYQGLLLVSCGAKITDDDLFHGTQVVTYSGPQTVRVHKR